MEERIIINLLRMDGGEFELSEKIKADALLGTEATGSLRSAGPISCSIQARVYDDKELVAQVTMQVPLRVRCERCLKDFDFTLPVTCTVSVSLEGDEKEVDLTDELHEEVMLALPPYPKCELIGESCQINDVIGEFGLDKGPKQGVNCVAAGERSVWDALDAVSNPPS